MLNLNKPKRLASYEKMVQSSITSKVLSYLVNQDIQPNYDEYLALNTALQSGDEPMDQVMQWMLQNPKLHRKYFETALYEGLDKLPHNIPELTDFFIWLNKNQFGMSNIKLTLQSNLPID